MTEEQRKKAKETAAARLAAMQSAAEKISKERANRVARIDAEDAATLKAEEEARKAAADGMKGRGSGKSGPEFLLNEYRRLGDQDLGDAIRGRGRASLVRDRDD